MKRCIYFLFTCQFLVPAISMALLPSITFSGDGDITSTDAYHQVNCVGDSTVLVSGGLIEGWLVPSGNSEVLITNGTIQGISPTGNSNTVMHGGSVGYAVVGDGYSYFNLYGGVVGNLVTYELSTFNIYGGIISDHSEFKGSSIVNIYGGNWLDYSYANENSSCQIHIYGKNLQYQIMHGGGGVGQLTDGGKVTGLWADGTPFQIDLMNHLSESTFYDHVTLHEIPEPCTILLLCLGGLLVKRR